MPQGIGSVRGWHFGAFARLNRRVWLLGAAMAALVLGATAAYLRSTHAGRLAEAALGRERIVRVVTASLERTAAATDALLAVLARRIGALDPAVRADPAALRAALEQAAPRPGPGQVLAVAGPDLALRATTLSEPPDPGALHAALRAHAPAGPDRMLVGAPVPLGRRQDLAIPFSRPVRDAAGAFAGAVVLAVAPQVQADWLAALGLDPDHVALLTLADGTLIARHPPRDDRLGVRPVGSAAAAFFAGTAPHAAMRQVDPRDGGEMLIDCRRLAGQPLAACIAVPRARVLAAWTADATVIGGLAAAWCAMLLGATALLARAAGQRERLLDEAGELAGRFAAAAEANTHKTRFLASASHDARQPLHALALLVSALKRRVRDQEAARLVGEIERATASMQALFGALLDVSRIEAGVLRPELRAVPVADVLAALRAEFAALARERGIRLTILRSSATVRTDPDLLAGILRNLIGNAIKFSLRGRVVVGCRRRGAALRIEVHDTGPGIPERQREDIFREWHRLPPGQTRGRPGFGLGLAIVRRLADALGAPVELRSVERRGSCFAVGVPLAEAAAAAAPAPEIEPARALAGRRIMVIDDDPAIADALARELTDLGARVTALMSAAAAERQIAGGERPDLMVVDGQLMGTEVDAPEFLDRIALTYGFAAPVLIVTGSTQRGTLERLEDSGYPYLTKPVAPALLVERIAALLRSGAA